MEANRQGRNHCQRGSFSSISSEQVRNWKTLCMTCNAPRNCPALVKGPNNFAPLIFGDLVTSTRGKSSWVVIIR